MAAVIFHGAPGSYKTSSAIWFEMLIALRAGRIVVTNIEGMKPIDEVEKLMGERFPETADIWRISTQKKKGLFLMRRFFHWCPIGAQIIIDEVQDVFPAERTFKPETLDYQPIDVYQDEIKPEWIKIHKQLLETVKPEQLSSSDVDDLGEEVFDSNGHIIYPSTLKESFMRHRKYNWDIVVCTPDITQVNMLIRGACETAFNHMSKDVIGKIIPYFKARPRIRQHPPKENGLTARKSDVVSYRKMPEKVFALYKSTATGANNVSGVGKSPFETTGFKFGAVLVVGFIIYLALLLGGAFDQKAVANDANTGQKIGSKVLPNSSKNIVVPSDNSNNKNPVQNLNSAVFVSLPFEPTYVYLTSSHKVYKDGVYQGVKLDFRFVTEDGDYHFDSVSIVEIGLKAELVSDCLAKLTGESYLRFVSCPPSKQLNYASDNASISSKSEQLPTLF